MNLLRDQVRRLQERLEFIEDSRIFQDPESSSSSGSAHVPHQTSYYLKFQKPLPRIQNATKYTRGYEFSKKRFLFADPLDEILTNYTVLQRIWQHHRAFWEEKELREVGAKSHCNQYLYFAFTRDQGKRVQTTEIVLCQ